MKLAHDDFVPKRLLLVQGDLHLAFGHFYLVRVWAAHKDFAICSYEMIGWLPRIIRNFNRPSTGNLADCMIRWEANTKLFVLRDAHLPHRPPMAKQLASAPHLLIVREIFFTLALNQGGFD